MIFGYENHTLTVFIIIKLVKYSLTQTSIYRHYTDV